MKFSKIKSHAKINLALNITGKNKHLHKIESMIAFIDLHDVILIKRIKSNIHNISFNGKFSRYINKTNSVHKLLMILEQKKLLMNKKFQIKITKNIPIKSGLGGGSMNAASILNYLLKKRLITTSKKQITKISNLVGSDVVLGLNSQNSVLTSSNKISRFTKCKKIYTLIIKPNFGCSTKEIYSKVKKFDKPQMNRPNKNMFNLNYLRKMGNSLEPIVFSRYKRLRNLKLYLENLSNPIFVRMTGSGSALVAYFQSKARCESAKKKFVKKYKNYWCMASKTI
tara:strand:- start:83 stop:928 length:846 start_codon:yes stop_codon:yes gene_type:complete